MPGSRLTAVAHAAGRAGGQTGEMHLRCCCCCSCCWLSSRREEGLMRGHGCCCCYCECQTAGNQRCYHHGYYGSCSRCCSRGCWSGEHRSHRRSRTNHPLSRQSQAQAWAQTSCRERRMGREDEEEHYKVSSTHCDTPINNLAFTSTRALCIHVTSSTRGQQLI